MISIAQEAPLPATMRRGLTEEEMKMTANEGSEKTDLSRPGTTRDEVMIDALAMIDGMTTTGGMTGATMIDVMMIDDTMIGEIAIDDTMTKEIVIDEIIIKKKEVMAIERHPPHIKRRWT